MNLPFPEPPTNKEEIDGWFKLLTVEQLEAAKVYYYDRWNWESGNSDDLDIYERLVSEITERKMLEIFMDEISDSIRQYVDDDIIEQIVFDAVNSPTYSRKKDED